MKLLQTKDSMDYLPSDRKSKLALSESSSYNLLTSAKLLLAPKISKKMWWINRGEQIQENRSDLSWFGWEMREIWDEEGEVSSMVGRWRKKKREKWGLGFVLSLYSVAWAGLEWDPTQLLNGLKIGLLSQVWARFLRSKCYRAGLGHW